MQTFLPFEDFDQSAAVLDRERLGKQRIEAWQILKINLLDWADEKTSAARIGWANHPAVKMWRGYEGCLASYGEAICREWRRRGYEDTILPRFETIVDDYGTEPRPPWLGDQAFHRAHRLKLLWKAPATYRRHFSEQPPAEEPDYIWPNA